MKKKDSLLTTVLKSTARQVGRDTGKVISNELYGDKHATPIRQANNQTSQANNQTSGCLPVVVGIVFLTFLILTFAVLIGCSPKTNMQTYNSTPKIDTMPALNTCPDTVSVKTTTTTPTYKTTTTRPSTYREIHTGPRGGRYYYNSEGKKIYVK